MIFWDIIEKPIDVIFYERKFTNPHCGAVVCFAGKVRDHHQGQSVKKLLYEAHIPMTQKIFEKISTEALMKWDLKTVGLVHRLGILEIGEVAVWVGVESSHRKEAFEGASWIMDQIKKEAPIWKKEFFTDGSCQWGGCECVS